MGSPAKVDARVFGFAALLFTLAIAIGAFPPVAANGVPSGTPFATELAFLTTASAKSPTNWQAFDGNDFTLADINHQGFPEIVISNDNLHHYIIDPRTGLVVSELSTFHYAGYGGRELDAPAVGDVFGDGGNEIAIQNGAGYLSLWKFNPQGSNTSHFNMSKLWERWVNAKLWDPNFAATHPWNANETPTSEGHPFLADVNRNGTQTVFSNTEDVSTAVAFSATGSLRWFQDPPSDLNAGVAIADLNGDGRLEAVFASDAGPVYVYDAVSGAPLWSFDTRCTGGAWIGNGSNCNWSAVGSISITPTITDLFGDGKKEICFGVRDTIPASDPGWYGTAAQIQYNVDNSHAKLYCLTHDGHQLWMDHFDWSNPHLIMHPVPYDVNGDGVKDLIWIDWNTIGHKPGNFQTTTRGPSIFALDGRTGAVLWRESLTEGWSNKGIALADVFGDGRQLILADEYGPTGDDGLSVIDPANGNRLGWVALQHGWTASRGPVVGDLYGNGNMEIVVPMMRGGNSTTWCASHVSDVGCREGAIEILATGKAFRSLFNDAPTWNLPLAPIPPPAPFNATFTPTSTVNEWWIEVTVASTSPLAFVNASVNGGAWHALAKTSYGTWAASFNAPRGSSVVFRATDAAARIATSAAFTWLGPAAPKPPVASFSTQAAGLTVSLNASTSSDPNGLPLTYAWAFGDGANGAGRLATHVYAAAGTYTVALTVNDTKLSATATKSLTVTAASTFAATFTPTSSVNNWWVEAVVKANAPLSGVDARVNGGAWNVLASTSWGTWAKSFYAPTGANVQFRATSIGGAVAVSANMTWLASAPPGVTFTAVSPTNAWWVEVKVTSATTTITKVEAQVNNGTWINLPADTWGTWAKSFFVPANAMVRFRATDTSAVVTLSGLYAWA
ncbi:MAG: PKD domain-containing protein [Thermoplasmatota archaeon]